MYWEIVSSVLRNYEVMAGKLNYVNEIIRLDEICTSSMGQIISVKYWKGTDNAFSQTT